MESCDTDSKPTSGTAGLNEGVVPGSTSAIARYGTPGAPGVPGTPVAPGLPPAPGTPGGPVASAICFETPGAQVPYGWRVEGAGRGAMLVEVPTEQATIKRIVRARRRGQSFREIAERLNRDGVAAKGGGPWGWTSVRSVERRAVG